MVTAVREVNNQVWSALNQDAEVRGLLLEHSVLRDFVDQVAPKLEIDLGTEGAVELLKGWLKLGKITIIAVEYDWRAHAEAVVQGKPCPEPFDPTIVEETYAPTYVAVCAFFGAPSDLLITELY